LTKWQWYLNRVYKCGMTRVCIGPVTVWDKCHDLSQISFKNKYTRPKEYLLPVLGSGN